MAFVWASLYEDYQHTNLTSFILEARIRMDEPVEDVISDLQISRLANSGILDMARRAGLYPSFAECDADGSDYYLLPTNFEVLNEELVYISSDGQFMMIRPAILDEVQELSQGHSIPHFYLREGRRIYPYLRGATTGRFRIYGTKTPALFDTTIPDISYLQLMPSHVEPLYCWVLWWYFSKRRNYDEASFYRGLYYEIVKSIADEVENNLKRKGIVYGRP